MKAIEVTATVDAQHRLIIDHPLPIKGPNRVRVLILVDEESDDDNDWLAAAASNPSFDFLKEAEEDIYTASDGKPFHDEV